jgi:methionyl-tRNA formyltransferase
VRTVYLGTSGFAATVLRRLADSPHRPLLVVSPPDRPKGRGRRTQPPPVAEATRELGIELLQAESVNAEGPLARIRDARPGAVAVCAFGQLIREPLLSDPEMLNVHPSLLPRWRGAAPIERAIMAGDRETGVTIIRLSEGLDSGPIGLQETIEIGKHEAFPELSARLAELGGELAIRALDLRAGGELELNPQDEALAIHADKITPEERRLDPGRPAVELERVVRALGSHVGVYLALADGGRLGVREAAAAEGRLAPTEVSAADGRLLVGCRDGVLELNVVQPPGGRPMDAEAYLRGHDAPRLATAAR